MDKNKREALQVAKELTCKFIETRTVSPGNFAEVFPLIYRVVAHTIASGDGFAASEQDWQGETEPSARREKND